MNGKCILGLALMGVVAVAVLWSVGYVAYLAVKALDGLRTWLSRQARG